MNKFITSLLVILLLAVVAVFAQRSSSLTAALIIPPSSAYPVEQIRAAGLVGAELVNEFPKYSFKYTVRVVKSTNVSQSIRTLHQQNNLNVFFGALSSAEVASVESYVNANNILLFSTLSSSSSLAKVDNIYRSVGPNSQIAVLMSDHATNRLALQNIIIVYRNDNYGKDLNRKLIAAIGSTTATVLGSVSYPTTNYNVNTIATQVRALVPAGLNINKLGIMLISYDEYSDIMTKLIQYPRLKCYYIGGESTVQSEVAPDDIIQYVSTLEKGFSRVTFVTLFDYLALGYSNYGTYLQDVLSHPQQEWYNRIVAKANSGSDMTRMANYIFDTAYLLGVSAAMSQPTVTGLKRSVTAFASNEFLLTGPNKFDQFGDRKSLTYTVQYLTDDGSFILAV